MHSMCTEINIVIKILIDNGNKVNEISEVWDKSRQAILMQKKLDPILKNKIEIEASNLRYWRYGGSPHDKPDEGFTCDECKVVLSFPTS